MEDDNESIFDKYKFFFSSYRDSKDDIRRTDQVAERSIVKMPQNLSI